MKEKHTYFEIFDSLLLGGTTQTASSSFFFEKRNCLLSSEIPFVDKKATNDQSCSSSTCMAMDSNLFPVHETIFQRLQDLEKYRKVGGMMIFPAEVIEIDSIWELAKTNVCRILLANS